MSSPATAPSNQESQAGIGTAPSDQDPLAPLGDAQNFKVRNVFVTPTFRPVSQEGDPIVSEVCTGFVMEVRCPFSNKPLGVVSVLIDPHAGSEVEATIQELFAPTEFGGQQFDPTHNGVHHGFVEHVLDHARRNGCSITSGWGSSPRDVSNGYRDSISSTMDSLSEPRSRTVRYFDPKTNEFRVLPSGEKAPEGNFVWHDVDIALKGDLRGVDNLRRALRGVDPKKLFALGDDAGPLESALMNAPILTLRLFSASPNGEPEVIREKVYFVFAGTTIITLRDGASSMLQDGLADADVKKMLELEKNPAGMFFGLSEYCFERAEVAADTLDDLHFKELAEVAKSDGRLTSQALKRLLALSGSFGYMQRKFEAHEATLSTFRRRVLNGKGAAESAHDPEGTPATSHALPSGTKESFILQSLADHRQDTEDLVKRLRTGVQELDRLRGTSDSVGKNATDGDILRLTLIAGASALATGGAAAAIVEFIPEWAKETFFYGGFSAGTLLLVTAAVSWISKRRKGLE